LNLAAPFIGSIVAPLFTSIPEMVVFLVAIFAYKGEAGRI
jgi:Ca2+/Na+ antiporter